MLYFLTVPRVSYVAEPSTLFFESSELIFPSFALFISFVGNMRFACCWDSDADVAHKVATSCTVKVTTLSLKQGSRSTETRRKYRVPKALDQICSTKFH